MWFNQKWSIGGRKNIYVLTSKLALEQTGAFRFFLHAFALCHFDFIPDVTFFHLYLPILFRPFLTFLTETGICFELNAFLRHVKELLTFFMLPYPSPKIT